MMTRPIQAIEFPTWLDPIIFSIPGTPLAVSWYGLAYVFGILMACYWAVKTVRKKDIWIPEGMTRRSELIPSRTKLEDFAFWCFVGIVVGGRVGYTILYDLPATLNNPVKFFEIWKGGMSFHGGFAGVCLAAYWVSRKSKISLWRWADMAAIGAPIGLGAVRIANFINQELYGRETDVPWAFIFWGQDDERLARHPSQLYEAFLEGLVIFLILWFFARKRKALTKPGICAGLFFLLYGVFRTFVEFFREPDNIWQIHPYFTRGMLYSIPMIIIGLLIIRWASKRPPVAPKFMAEPTKDEPKETA